MQIIGLHKNMKKKRQRPKKKKEHHIAEQKETLTEKEQEKKKEEIAQPIVLQNKNVNKNENGQMKPDFDIFDSDIEEEKEPEVVIEEQPSIDTKNLSLMAEEVAEYESIE